MEKKVCSKCKEEKEVCEFYKDSTRKDGYRCQCKSCTKEWRLNNQKHLLEYHKNWKSSNSEHVYNYHKIYNEKNSEKIKKYQKEWSKQNKEKVNKKRKLRKQTDLIFSISCSIRKRVSEYIKKNKILKTNKTFDVVGCTPEFLKEYLESKFTNGMSWDNRSEWHIDHIVPLSSAKTEDELYKLCYYTNLQPLWAEDNLKKSNKIL